ncbi:MAG: F0F1 ATP synthase subunit B [Planctomycetes bacterium]|nr:F0F1 ATP synthase subunit B [Planctomycetota bacterium]
MRVRWIALFLGVQICLCDVLLASEEIAEGEQPPSVFSGTFGESIWTLVWFFVLLVVLWKFAWKPMLAGLTSRTEHIERQISDAEKTRAEAKKVLDEYGAKLADAERQGRDIIGARTKEAERQAKEVHQKTRKELQEKRIRAEADLDRERMEAADELWDQTGDIIRKLGKEVFGKTLDGDDNQKLIDEAIARLKEQQGQ